MATNRKRNPKSGSPNTVTMLFVILAGVAIGALLAFGAAPLVAGLCDSEPACQRQISALLGGFALMQAIHIAIVYVLVDRLNRESESRLLAALSRESDRAARAPSDLERA